MNTQKTEEERTLLKQEIEERVLRLMLLTLLWYGAYRDLENIL
uniref:Uncharacterized protein n=1 Tax=Marseillevirus sp. TaxID=2809551 RepID=A0AA96ELP6_9VIRU|nr:hypothetical protein MarFTMF_423 [Marseillevirus sp.]